MPIQYRYDNIFESDANVLINPCNTVGVAGAGLSLAFAEKFPANLKQYKLSCKNGELVAGKILPVYCGLDFWVVNLPTKEHYSKSSDYELIDQGMGELIRWIDNNPLVDSVAIPALGCGLGGLDWCFVKQIIENNINILSRKDVVFYIYPPQEV